MSIAENLKEIQSVKQWVAFRFEERNGKRTKIPVNPHTGGNAQTNNPQEVSPQEEKRSVGRPVSSELIREPGVQQGLKKEDTRATFILPVETVENLKAYAYTKNIKIREALTEIIDSFIADYEADPANEPLLRRGGKK